LGRDVAGYQLIILLVNYLVMKLINKINIKKLIPLFLFLATLGIGIYLVWGRQGTTLEVKNSSQAPGGSLTTVDPNLPQSPISGLNCADASRRPIAVIFGNDAEARPLSGISEADMVFEMQIVEKLITRIMAVYVCGNPKELGSIRSAREDFIPLARGLDAILVHWGGEHTALEKLNAGIMDNLDGLKDEVVNFFRKAGILSPHNGFSSMTRLIRGAGKKGYSLENKFIGYPHLADRSIQNKAMTLTIGYSGQYAVKYDYDPANNFYLRWRGGTKEIDKNNGQQVAAKNVVIMSASSQAISEQYNTVQIEGEGKATVYQNGQEIAATWKKDAKDQTSKLFFYDSKGQEIKFVPGQIWVEIVDPSQNIIWK